jgi:hypothetical protein
MAPESNSGGSNPVLAFLVSALLIGVVVLGYFVYTGGRVLPQSNNPSLHLIVKAPPAALRGG